ncbi:hypothetical protein jhhlp_003974 [Lomentospora prolificans]|uniref:N-glycosylation protein EOS1 n=1 Tax=Lomentospora prolificans TaxID=41688 RepID=A0A2N3NA94_9PEZI|nr:hypothetical protein jhhlp_003974 [Lomentospora prolificans]
MANSSTAPTARLSKSFTTGYTSPNSPASASRPANLPATTPSANGAASSTAANTNSPPSRNSSRPRQKAQSYLPSSILAPRVAVALNVPKSWHFLLFASRLLSVAPALAWGWPSALLLLDGVISSFVEGRRWGFSETASALACIWVRSTFPHYGIMALVLINYTPQATIVRLLTINAINAYLTSSVLALIGGFRDSRLLLPGWIGIATMLTILYHITHQQITIRKETSTSINVFSIASFLSMVALLSLLYTQQHHPDFPEIPLLAMARRLVRELRTAARRTTMAAQVEPAEP